MFDRSPADKLYLSEKFTDIIIDNYHSDRDTIMYLCLGFDYCVSARDMLDPYSWQVEKYGKDPIDVEPPSYRGSESTFRIFLRNHHARHFLHNNMIERR